MGFLTQMLSSEAKISSKRTVGFAAFIMLMANKELTHSQV